MRITHGRHRSRRQPRFVSYRKWDRDTERLSRRENSESVARARRRCSDAKARARRRHQVDGAQDAVVCGAQQRRARYCAQGEERERSESAATVQ